MKETMKETEIQKFIFKNQQGILFLKNGFRYGCIFEGEITFGDDVFIQIYDTKDQIQRLISVSEISNFEFKKEGNWDGK